MSRSPEEVRSAEAPAVAESRHRTLSVASLGESNSRLLISISPREKSKPLPSISSNSSESAETTSPQSSTISDLPSEPTTQPAESHEPRMLLDYTSRLAKFGPRLLRYARSKVVEGAKEPVLAFTSAASSVSHTPSAVTHTSPSRPHSEATQGFSLLDLERSLLEAASGWWKNSSKDSAGKSKTDSLGLDIDFSNVFKTSESRAKSGNKPPAPPDASEKFLNVLTAEEIIGVLESSGILSLLAKKGYERPNLVFDTSDEFQHRLSLIDGALYDTPGLNLSSSERFLVDLFMARRRDWSLQKIVSYQLMKRVVHAGSWDKLHEITGELRPPIVGIEGANEAVKFLESSVAKFSKLSKRGDGTLDALEIAWLQMHDPLNKEDKRPLLPGQRFVGLRIGTQTAAIMESMAEKSKYTDCIINYPFWAHNSFAYSTRNWIYLNPIQQAYVDWLQAELQPVIETHGYCFTAWAITHGHLRRVTYEISSDKADSQAPKIISSRLERWQPSEQIFPTSEAMRNLLQSKEWTKLRDKWRNIFNENGGAMGTGVSVVPNPENRPRRARLEIDLENCPELWKYSNIWKNRDPETGKFN